MFWIFRVAVVVSVVLVVWGGVRELDALVSKFERDVLERAKRFGRQG